MDNYSDALNLVYSGPNGNDIQAVSVIEEQEGSIRLAVTTFWAEEPRTVEFILTVPLVTPIRFQGDEGMFGHLIRLPHSRTTRFCHPLLVCRFAEDIAADRKKGAARFKFSKETDWDWEWLNWYGRVRRAVEGAISKLMRSQQDATTGFVRTQFRRAVSNLITPVEDQSRPNGWAENGSSGGDVCAGIPVSDECLVIRQMFEVRLGFPDVPGNDFLYEQLKMKFVEVVDLGLPVIVA